MVRSLLDSLKRPRRRRWSDVRGNIGPESLESRRLLSVSADEQFFVYRLNRARHDPVAYQTEANLPVSLASVAPSPPLAINDSLFDSSGFKSTEMATANYFGHRSAVTGIWPNELLRNNGYALDASLPDDSNQVESLAAGQNSVESAMDSLIVDAGVPSLGHRKHLLSMDSFNADNREIGVGYAFNSGSTFQHYWSIHITRSSATDKFLTGVVYNDANGNERYDRNEGLGGVTVSNGSVSTTTNAHGGWSLKVGSGEYLVTATGGAFQGTSAVPVAVGSDSVEVDFLSGLSTGQVGFSRWDNTAPVLDNSGNPTLLPVIRDETSPSANLVADLIVGRVTDPDPAVRTGLAIEQLNGSGTWQYSTNGDNTWRDFGSVSSTNARLLGASDVIRFVPNAGFIGTATLGYRAWDQTTGTIGGTADVSNNGGTTAYSAAVEMATLTVIDSNTAPTLDTTANPTFSVIAEDSTGHAGDSVASLLGTAVFDPDPGSVAGIGIVSLTGSDSGAWQYSLDSGLTWANVGDATLSSARLLRPLDRLRYVPNPDFNGSASLRYHAWDQMTGTAGSTADLTVGTGGTTSFSTASETAAVTVTAVNDAPVLDDSHTPKLTPVPVNTPFSNNGGNTVAEIIGTAITDVDAGALEGIAVIGKSGNGNWWFRNDGSWSGGTTSRTFAWLLKPTDRIQFTPANGWTGTASIEFIAWDQTTGPTNSNRWANVSTTNLVGGTTAYSVASDTATVFVGNAGTAPNIISIVRADSNPAQSSRVRYTATFSEEVTGVDPTDFQLTTSGNVTGTISAVTGSGTTRTITIDQINGEGTLQLRFSSAMNIKDEPGNLLNVSGFAGSELYTIAPLKLELGLSSSRIQENNGARASVGTVTRLNSDNTADLTVTLTSGDTSEASVPTSVVIPAGQTSATFDIDAVDDNTLDGTRNLTLTVSATDFQSAQAELTVDDHETLTISVDPSSIAEDAGDNAGTITVVRSNTDDAQAPADLNIVSSDTTEATVDILSVPFTFNAVDDFLIDGRQTVIFTATAAGFVSGQATVFVDDNDVAGFTVTEVGGSTRVSESGTSDILTVVLDAKPTSNVVIDVSASDPGEAVVDVASLTFTPFNWNVVQTVTVTGQNENLADGDQTTIITMSVNDSASDVAFTGVSDQIVSVITTDDDVPGIALNQSDGDTQVAESGTTDTFTLALNVQPLSDVVIDIVSGDPGEAAASVTSLTFTPGNWNVAQSVTMIGQDDDLLDGNQITTVTISVNLASSDDAYLSVANQTIFVTTVDDDSAGFSVVQSDETTRVSETGTTDTFTVVLNAQPTSDVVLEIVSGDPGEATIDVATLTFTPANWNMARTVTVTGVDDGEPDGSQTTNLTLSIKDSESDDQFHSVPDQTVSVVTTDDDGVTFTVVESDGSTTVSESGTSDTFTVVLDSQPAANVVIEISTGNAAEVMVSAGSLLFTPANWNVQQQVTVTGVDDAIVDGEQDTAITLSAVDSNVEDQTIRVITTDDDIAGFTISESADNTRVSESGTTDTFSVVLDAQPSSVVVLEISSGDTGEVGVDVASLTFTPENWNIAQTVTVIGRSDDEVDGNQITDITVSVQGSIHPGLPRFGNGLFELQSGNVLDSNTGLEWLDLRPTDNQSFEQVSERINGGDLSGWSFASPEQLTQLYLNAGIPEESLYVHHGDNYAPAATLLSFWGEFIEPPPDGETNQWFLNSAFAFNDGVARRQSGQIRLPAGQSAAVSPGSQFRDASEAFPGLSSALIRSTDYVGQFLTVPNQTISITTVDIDAQMPGNVDGDADFDANDSFMIHLMLLSGTDLQIDQSKGSSPLEAAQIRANVVQLATAADIDGDGDFDANDSFLIHLAKLSGTDTQIDQSKGGSPLTAAQIRANVNSLGPASGAASQPSRRLTKQMLVASDPKHEGDAFPTLERASDTLSAINSTSRSLFPVTPSAERLVLIHQDAPNPSNADSVAVWTNYREWIDAI